MLGDRAYDSAELREQLGERGIKPVIPNRCNRKQPFSFSKRLYKLRWRIENAFSGLHERRGPLLRGRLRGIRRLLVRRQLRGQFTAVRARPPVAPDVRPTRCRSGERHARIDDARVGRERKRRHAEILLVIEAAEMERKHLARLRRVRQ
jgi:hypothetical protein